jgi:long-chain acyl-CoA synthetase
MMTEDKTINGVFKETALRLKSQVAIEKKRNGQWESATWAQYYDRAQAAGLAFKSLGVAPGDRISILSDNRLEWLYADMGGLGIGASIVPIYPTVTEKEVLYIVKNSASKILVVENAVQLEKARYAKKKFPGLKTIVVMNEEDITGKSKAIMSFKALLTRGEKQQAEKPDLFEKLAAAVKLSDPATMVYTSGTTGTPKGAMITHANIMAVMNSLHNINPRFATDQDQTVPFLPLCHVFERITGHFYGSIFVGITSSYAESINSLLDDFKERRPTMVLAVPRVCEKVYQKTMAQVQEQPAWKQKVFFWSQKVGARISELREAKKPIPPLLGLQYKVAYRMVFKKLQDGLGGRVRWMTASGGPTAIEIVRFFNSAGITVIGGYGMTECTAPVTMQNLSDYKIGTAGEPVPGMEVKIADDGEILVKGDNVISGYWNMPDETKEAFTEDGYFMTGDIGEFDRSGYLTITDRKKDLIITAGGKNVAPQKIENLFKSDPIFSQFIVVGDRRKYLSALYNINLEQAEITAREKNIPFGNPENLLENEVFLKLVEDHVAVLNKKLARYETIKKVALVKNEFSEGTGELTSTLKVKRKIVHEKYKELIDGMYAERLYE